VKHEFALGHDLYAMYAYNKIHVRYRIWVEWVIGGLNTNEKN
jgi:hypothetical protein